MDELPKPDRPAWKGPIHGGVTQSIINKFLECPYRFYIYAVLGLEDNIEPHPNLIWGDSFHRALEEVINTPKLIQEFDEEDFARIDTIVDNHINERWPRADASYPHTIKAMYRLYDDSYKEGEWVAEQKLEQEYTTKDGITVLARGKVDGMKIGSGPIAEHKAKGRIDSGQSRAETPQDLQVNWYCKLLGRTEIIYDLIRIPEAQFYVPQRRMGEQWRNWADRIFHREAGKQDYPIAQKKHLWLQQFPVYLTKEDIDDYCKFVIDPLILKLVKYWDYVTSPGFNPNDPACYNELFYKKPIRAFDPSRTEIYKCSYHGLLSGQENLEDLRPTHFYAELEDEAA